MTLTLLEQGSFTSDGTAKQIPLSGGANYFTTLNYTQAATQQATGRGVKFEWFSGFADGYALETKKTNSTDALNLVVATSGGFNYVQSRPLPEAPKTGTTITQAAGAVCTSTSHGYAIGDRVRIYGNVVMHQIAGMEFTITAVTSNTFTLGYLDSSGFANPETGFTVRRIAKYAEVLPEYHFITAITQATQAVVTFSSTHNYKLGDVIYLRVSSNFGMVEMDQQSAKCVAVDTVNNTVTLDINSSSFTAFAFPLASVYPNIVFSVGTVQGKNGLVDDFFNNINPVTFPLDPYRQATVYPYMNLQPGAQGPAGSTSDVIYWQAWRQENN